MDQPGSNDEVTTLLRQFRCGDSAAADRLIPIVLHELRVLARAVLKGERPNHTLQPTALINEAYFRLIGDQNRDWENRAHFFNVAASVIRRILIDHARRRQSLKRIAGEALPFREEAAGGMTEEQACEVLDLNVALERLAQMSERQSHVVELRYFGGLSIEETACAMGVTPITVKRDWLAARAWLKGQLRPESPLSLGAPIS